MVSTDQSSAASGGAKKVEAGHAEDSSAKKMDQAQDMEMLRLDSDEDHEHEPKVIPTLLAI